MKFIIPALAFITLALSSCRPEPVDEAPPTMLLSSFDPFPQPDTICGELENWVFHVQGGDTLKLDALFTDNEGLSQYKLDIHQNFDCHGHKDNTQDWTLLEIVDLEGPAASFKLALPVPANVTAGAYHFQIQVLDASGNEDEEQAIFSIKVLNPLDTLPPALQLTNPAQTELTVSKGESVLFSGQLSDSGSLMEGGNGRVECWYTRQATGNSFLAWSQAAPAGSTNAFDFSENFTIPTSLVAGAYTFTLRGYDGVNNEGIPRTFKINITD